VLEGDAKKRFLEIHKNMLLAWHKEAESIINQESFTKESVDRLQAIYNMAEEYSGDYFALVPNDVVSLKESLAEILKKNQRVSISFDQVMDKVKNRKPK
jgi:hypothetical protein